MPRHGLVWAHASLSALFGDVPLTDVLILLIGLTRVSLATPVPASGSTSRAVAGAHLAL